MTSRPWLAGAAVVVAATAAACTSELSSAPGPVLTSTTSTTTTTTSTTSTTTTTTTVAATTTTLPPTTLPAGPVALSFPLFVGGAEGGWLPLGSWEVDEWVSIETDEDGSEGGDEDDADLIDPGTELSISRLAGEENGTAGSPVEACFDGRRGPDIDVTIAAPEPPGYGYGAVALPRATWDLTPRPIAVTGSGPAAYEQLGADAFADAPVDPEPGAVEQLVVTDLDGDGDDEALVAYEFVQPSVGPGAPGDLAALLLVDTVTRNAATVLQSLVDGTAAADDTGLIERFRVIDVADYNGDGTMEVAVHAWYYEGASVVVYGYDGAILTEVLAAGCGA